MIRIAINGFGRIGRNFFRVLFADQQALKKISLVAINIGPSDPEHVAHMLKYDSIMRTYPGEVMFEDGHLIVDKQKIKIISQPDISKIDWGAFKVDWVVESSGKFTTRDKAALHIGSGVPNVLITAPATGDDVTIIPGVNDDAFDPSSHHIVSLGSCSTNALLPILKVLDVAFRINQAFMTSVHSYTNSQVLLDIDQKDLRRARAAALNIIPTSSGATESVAKVMPELANKVGGYALRIPIANVSFMDVSFIAQKEASIDKINQAFIHASKHEPFRGIIGFTNEPLVSSDFLGISESVIIDGQLTSSIAGCHKVCGWYDNEWGYSMRLKDFLMQSVA